MYLRHLQIRDLKLLRRLDLDFTRPDGRPRLWTVIIGENGTCKTSILRAIAMAAAGGHVGGPDGLVDTPAQYADKRRGRRPARILCEFGIDSRLRHLRLYPGFAANTRPDGDVAVAAQVRITGKDMHATASSRYSTPGLPIGTRDVDPVREAREDDRSLWFVAGYGVERTLPRPDAPMRNLRRPSIDRLRPLFTNVELAGTTFVRLFETEKARFYNTALQAVLFSAQKLLPGFAGLEPGVPDLAGGVLGFLQEFPTGNVSLPGTWLSHGYQSTIAWVADLVGHILLEAGLDRDLPPAEMEGLVLIDEIDLYLHPVWQCLIIRALRDVFPRLQFVATTHSPLCLVGLRMDLDEIVVLRANRGTGDVERVDVKGGRPQEPDPRLMTGTEIYRTYFGIKRLYPSDMGELLRQYRYLAADPMRTDEDDRRLEVIEAALRLDGVDVQFPREPRVRE